VTRFAKPVAFVAALLPAGDLVWAAFTENLSANPLGDITNATGDWALRFLCLTLAVTPLRRLSGWSGAIRFRRMLGLFAFFYGTLHFLTYLFLDRLGTLDWQDIARRPFILVGFAAFVLMVPLAATSTAGMIRRLGGRRWRALHRLMYVSCVAAVVHYWWLVKIDVRRPLAYGAVITVLLGLRIVRAAWGDRPGGFGG
jgi:sulfoxide reductase heme-binding subunit YedZ